MGVVIQNQRGKVGEIPKNNFVDFENQQSSQKNKRWDQQTEKSALQTIPYGVSIGSSQDNRNAASKTFTGDKSDLISAATSEKTALVERLRAYFDTTSRKTLLANKAEEAVSQKSILNEVPMVIFIG